MESDLHAEEYELFHDTQYATGEDRGIPLTFYHRSNRIGVCGWYIYSSKGSLVEAKDDTSKNHVIRSW